MPCSEQTDKYTTKQAEKHLQLRTLKLKPRDLTWSSTISIQDKYAAKPFACRLGCSRRTGCEKDVRIHTPMFSPILHLHKSSVCNIIPFRQSLYPVSYRFLPSSLQIQKRSGAWFYKGQAQQVLPGPLTLTGPSKPSRETRAQQNLREPAQQTMEASDQPPQQGSYCAAGLGVLWVELGYTVADMVVVCIYTVANMLVVCICTVATMLVVCICNEADMLACIYIYTVAYM